MENRYYDILAAAYIRGLSIRTRVPELEEHLREADLEELSKEEIQDVLKIGEAAGIKLYNFKNTHGDMPRVKRALGFLKSVEMGNLLDIGSGRGVFLFPFLMEFPWVNVTSLDLLERRVQFMQDMRCGGLVRLSAEQKDICEQPFADKSFDVVTMLEVLEHIPNVQSAITAAVHIARKYIVVTVPSKPDDNPEHIHLLTKDLLTDMFEKAGCTKIHFDGVNGHLFLVVTIE